MPNSLTCPSTLPGRSKARIRLGLWSSRFNGDLSLAGPNKLSDGPYGPSIADLLKADTCAVACAVIRERERPGCDCSMRPPPDHVGGAIGLGNSEGAAQPEPPPCRRRVESLCLCPGQRVAHEEVPVPDEVLDDGRRVIEGREQVMPVEVTEGQGLRRAHGRRVPGRGAARGACFRPSRTAGRSTSAPAVRPRRSAHG